MLYDSSHTSMPQLRTWSATFCASGQARGVPTALAQVNNGREYRGAYRRPTASPWPLPIAAVASNARGMSDAVFLAQLRISSFQKLSTSLRLSHSVATACAQPVYPISEPWPLVSVGSEFPSCDGRSGLRWMLRESARQAKRHQRMPLAIFTPFRSSTLSNAMWM